MAEYVPVFVPKAGCTVGRAGAAKPAKGDGIQPVRSDFGIVMVDIPSSAGPPGLGLLRDVPCDYGIARGDELLAPTQVTRQLVFARLLDEAAQRQDAGPADRA